MHFLVTSFGFVFLFGLGFFQTVYFIMYVVLVDFLLTGLVSSTILWAMANKFMREPDSENVEWGYSFDVWVIWVNISLNNLLSIPHNHNFSHINAIFPPLIILHFFMLIFYKIFFSYDWFISTLLGNLLWLAAICYYTYISFLGYNCE